MRKCPPSGSSVRCRGCLLPCLFPGAPRPSPRQGKQVLPLAHRQEGTSVRHGLRHRVQVVPLSCASLTSQSGAPWKERLAPARLSSEPQIPAPRRPLDPSTGSSKRIPGSTRARRFCQVPLAPAPHPSSKEQEAEPCCLPHRGRPSSGDSPEVLQPPRFLHATLLPTARVGLRKQQVQRYPRETRPFSLCHRLQRRY